jgi:hypothetical protein
MSTPPLLPSDVKHPNYDKIINEFLAGGLENLAENVPLTIGKSNALFVI